MQVHRDINHLPDFQNAALTIGTFDGVHKGHVRVIDQLVKEARQTNGESVLITFHPHPRLVIDSEKRAGGEMAVQLLNTPGEKIELLARHSIDHLVIVPFTQAFSELTAKEYIEHFLVEKFRPKTIITGYDHRFGKGRKGDYKLLEAFRKKFGYQVKEIPAHILHDITISSTNIRRAIMEGDMTTANENLGYDYFFSGIVKDGNKLGRTIGYPTANLHLENVHKLIPGFGIYAVYGSLGKHSRPDMAFMTELNFKGMMSIGIRPTIGDNKVMTEVNIFDFEENIYGRELRVYVKEYLRDEIKFDNLQDLKAQIARDEIMARDILAQV